MFAPLMIIRFDVDLLIVLALERTDCIHDHNNNTNITHIICDVHIHSREWAGDMEHNTTFSLIYDN